MMKPSPGSLSLIASLASLGLAACGDEPPAPAEVRSRISADLPRILGETRAALEGSTAALPGGAALGALDRALGTSSVDTAQRVRTAIAGFTARAGGGARPADPTVEDAVVAYLVEKVFTDENHAGGGIYRVPAALACTELTLDGDGQSVEVVDPECAANWDLAQLRIRTSTDGGELQLALQLGPDRDEPLTLGLEDDAISLTVDLDEATRAGTVLAPLFGQDFPNVALSGEVTSRLEILATAHVKASYSIDRALSIKLAEEGDSLDDPDAFRLTSAKSRVLAFELDGATGRGSFEYDLGATKAHIVDDTELGRDRWEIDLPGITARGAFGPGLPLELTNLSLGDRTTTVARNGVIGARWDLNPSDGRAFDITITTEAAGREIVEVSPKLDLRAELDFAALGEPAPVYSTRQLLLDGRIRGDEARDQIEVLSGSLRMTTDPASYGFTAAAGQCVRTADVQAPDGEWYVEWTAGACQ